MAALTLAAPAKVNLFLRVLGKRHDSFHALATLMQTVDLADQLTLSLSKEDRLICTDTSIGSNLVTEAVDLFRKKTALQFNVSILLEKNIPTQAGLGGGSSDAAAALKGVNRLLGSPVSVEELQLWSAEIGSDVPFFFSSGTAYCTGRGEIIRDLPRIEQKFALYKPQIGLSTPAVYQALDLKSCSKEDPEELLEKFAVGNYHYVNDLEKPAFQLLPELAAIKKRFGATMSGSGTAFFYRPSVEGPILGKVSLEESTGSPLNSPE